MAHPNANKGHAFERVIARILSSVWEGAKRGMQFRGGGKEFEDITNTPFHFECSKGGESIWAKWKQAVSDCKHKGKPPIVIKQRDYENPVVMIDLYLLLYLLDPSFLWLPQYTLEFPKGPVYEVDCSRK
jgi:hypothetical protein